MAAMVSNMKMKDFRNAQRNEKCLQKSTLSYRRCSQMRCKRLQWRSRDEGQWIRKGGSVIRAQAGLGHIEKDEEEKKRLKKQNFWKDFSKAVLVPPKKRFKRGSMLVIELGGSLPETENPQGIVFGSQPLTLRKIVSALVAASEDPRVPGIFLKISSFACGWAKLEEIRRAIKFVRDAGKFSMCYSELPGMKEYYIMSACEEIYVPPGAYLSVRGIAVSGSFLRGVFEKIGIEPQVMRIGKYKSAGTENTSF